MEAVNMTEQTKETSASPQKLEDLSIKEIVKLIPHRYPFLLIDKIEEIELGSSAVGVKNVSMNEWFFQGHFPDHPIMPGVLIIEAMAQTAGALVVRSLQYIATASSDNETSPLEQTESPIMVYFMSVESAKFRKPVTPGDVLRMKVTKERQHGTVWKFKGEAFVNNRLVSEAVFTAMIVDESKKHS